ncbi:hypothetical protein UA08_04663 [Talaromyces atroroseus]|uniref:Xylanolytic transcriptional activator regulatory domain-containing protein n=1 Tax=Talaromyces atroroseus TaxID=1441469 RepID=A0A225AY28_TALAT|nr:hypothetical protein UA08_04663 [Talaromyces atroroseus]OKL59876.1 hypothetical protein UA08_04663 [Talaromyces atroroseus]
MMAGYTSLYSGLSGDQGPDLLRHLSFNQQNLFGTSLWTAWRVMPRMEDPVYFTMFPDEHLDPHDGLYATSKMESPLAEYEPELVDLFYTYVHPFYPVMDCNKEEFIRRRRSGKVRASLVSCIYIHAVEFWHKSESLKERPIPQTENSWNSIFVRLAVETRTPNLDTVRALLLYMQLPSHHIRAPNRPGHWSLSTLLVGVAQDIGLHIDPTQWQIPMAERKARRVLWWAVYAHDKWMAHWLGRPPHIGSDDWSVEPLGLDDFSDDSGRIRVSILEHIKAFITFVDASVLLDEILRLFYTVRSKPLGGDDVKINTGVHARFLSWIDTVTAFKQPSFLAPNVISLRIACYTLELSILRGILRYEQDTSHGTTIRHALQIVKNAMDTLGNMGRLDKDGLWPSYCTGNLQIMGSVLVSLCLSSTDDEILAERSSLLLDFQTSLQNLLGSTLSTLVTAKHPLVRLNLILDQIFTGQNDIP